jgi:flagellar hook-associated protein 2
MSEITSTSTIVQSLNAGSGIDIKNLAQSLAEAENAPLKNRITSKIEEKTLTISGYSIAYNSISSLKDVMTSMDDMRELKTTQVASSAASAVEVQVNGDEALTGTYDITVRQLAQSQSNMSNSQSGSAAALNSGVGFSLTVTLGVATPVAHQISVVTDTPQGVVDAINAADMGVSAILVNTSSTGDDWRIVLNGPTGSDNDFSVSSAVDLGFAANPLRLAADAIVTMNGITNITRSSNTLTDVIPGVTMNLLQADVSQAISVRVTEDQAPLRTAVEGLIAAYNDFNLLLSELADPDSDISEFSGALASDYSTVRMLRDRVRSALLADSSTPSGSFSALRDIGVELGSDGQFSLNEDRYNAAIASNFDDVVTMFSAGTNDQSKYSVAAKGFAADTMSALDELIADTGALKGRQSSAESFIVDYEERLAKIELRLTAAYEGYLKQFAAMDTLVDQMQGIGTYLDGQFEMMRNNTRN